MTASPWIPSPYPESELDPVPTLLILYNHIAMIIFTITTHHYIDTEYFHPRDNERGDIRLRYLNLPQRVHPNTEAQPGSQ